MGGKYVTLTTKEAAARLGVTRRWIQYLIKRGTLTASKPGGRDLMISEESIKAYEKLKKERESEDGRTEA